MKKNITLFKIMQSRFHTLSKNILIFNLSLILSACSFADAGFNKLGFNVKNYFYNDNNINNHKFERKYDKLNKRTPVENKKYIAATKQGDEPASDIPSQDTPIKAIKTSNFWAPYYTSTSSKPVETVNTESTHQAVKVEKVKSETPKEPKKIDIQVSEIKSHKTAISSTTSAHPGTKHPSEKKPHLKHQTTVQPQISSKHILPNSKTIDSLDDEQIEVLNEVEFVPADNKNVANPTNYRYQSKSKPIAK